MKNSVKVDDDPSEVDTLEREQMIINRRRTTMPSGFMCSLFEFGVGYEFEAPSLPPKQDVDTNESFVCLTSGSFDIFGAKAGAPPPRTPHPQQPTMMFIDHRIDRSRPCA